MTKEEVLIWLTQLGKDWVGLHEVYEVYGDEHFWGNIQKWHDGAYITKRNNTYNLERWLESPSIEQYRLTKRALELLTST